MRRARASRLSTLWTSIRVALQLGPLGKTVLVVAPVVAAALFYVWTHVTTVQIGYALSRASEAHQALVEENRGLRIETAALKAPDRLKKLARTRFRMRSPQSSQVVRVEGDRP